MTLHIAPQDSSPAPTAHFQAQLENLYGLAQEAFDGGDYATADIHAARLNNLFRIAPLPVSRTSSAQQPSCSIIIVSYRHSDDVNKQLDRLEKYSLDPAYEVIIVDNGNRHIASILEHLDFNCTLIEPGLNLGCSGGRNLGALQARGETLVFLDDDGWIEADAIEHLLECKERYSAICVRGKVLPKSADLTPPAHYDKGTIICPSIPDTEGISAWARRPFLEFGGFNLLLAGHEGLELFSKMYRFFGPQKFLYAPNSILYHDFSEDPTKLKAKTALQDRNRRYLEFKEINWRDLVRTMQQSSQQRELRLSLKPVHSNSKRAFQTEIKAPLPPLSVITTAHNCERFASDYTASLRQQTHRDFEVIFVDDGSDDKTVELIRQAWSNDPRLKVVEIERAGRAAALMRAVTESKHDLCAIADMDDVSVPQRFEWTAKFFADNPAKTCLSFYCFNEHSPIRMPRPFPVAAQSVRCRSFVGMPVSFPTFAFRRSAFPEPFDPDLVAGVDCDWIFRNLAAVGGDGDVIPLPAVYYRVHDQQITTSKRNIQKDQALKCTINLHEQYLGTLTEDDLKWLAKLSGWEPIEHGRELSMVWSYILQLSDAVDQVAGTDSARIREHLHLTFLDLQERRMRRDYDAVKRRLDSENSKRTHAPMTVDMETDYGALGYRRLFLPFGYAAVAALGPKRDRKRFMENPAAFYSALPVEWQRQWGLYFFPEKAPAAQRTKQ